MGVCESTNKKNRPNKSSKNSTRIEQKLKRTSTLKRGETHFGKQGDNLEALNTGRLVEGGSLKIEAFLSLNNLTSIDKFLKIKLQICNEPSSNQYITVGETESQIGHSMIFNVSFVFEYYFEKEQFLKLTIIENDNNEYATIFTTVGKVMGSRKSSLTLSLKDKKEENIGDLTIDCKNASKSVIELKINLSCIMKSIKNINEHFEIYFLINNFNDDKNWRKVYKSTEQSGILEKAILFPTVTVMMDEICGENYDRPFMIEFHNVSFEPIGYCKVTLNELKLRSNYPIYKNKEGSEETIGEITINYQEQKILKFLDFLSLGMQINLVCGIDFTASNIDPNLPNSLHYCKGSTANPYERAIRSCGSIVGYYDYDQKFPVYGFGGVPPGKTHVEHCFNLNLEANPEIFQIENIIVTYKSALFKVRLEGPTYFAPLITSVLNTIKIEMNGPDLKYYILMILTDGIINDMDKTCDILVECAKYPISVIIIGIGKADFTNMDILDGDKDPLINSKNEKTKRDLVQFVEFNKFENNMNKLAEEVLKEVPRQVEEYFKLTGTINKFANMTNNNITSN